MFIAATSSLARSCGDSAVSIHGHCGAAAARATPVRPETTGPTASVAARDSVTSAARNAWVRDLRVNGEGTAAAYVRRLSRAQTEFMLRNRRSCAARPRVTDLDTIPTSCTRPWRTLRTP